MKAFAPLLDALSFMGRTLGKRRLMAQYFRTTPDPARGWALAALTGDLSIASAKPAMVRALIETQVDPVLFRMSYHYVGDLAETVALLWPGNAEGAPPTLPDVMDALETTGRKDVPEVLAGWLDRMDASERWALLKLVTGNLRVGVSARLARAALGDAFGRDPAEIEDVWHGLEPPYVPLFAWLEGRGERPQAGMSLAFRPMMLAHPLEDAEVGTLDLAEYQVEWKWDGIRVQAVKIGDRAALYTRTGDDISKSFPDLLEALLEIDGDMVVDGELLVVKDGVVASFNELQQRLNRKSVTTKMLAQYPAFLRIYDILQAQSEDLRALPLTERRARLEAWAAAHPHPRMDVSPIFEAPSWEALDPLRATTRDDPALLAAEGFMLKRRDSPYLAGRPRGHWFKYKRDTLTLDCVMMYAQRGHGKRSSFYSDYTFGVWEGDVLLPIGKAYSGFTDAELTKLDKWVRAHTVNRFGSVREVSRGLVLEIEFDAIQPSSRHKSGLSLRFPRVHRIRWDKPAEEADTLETARKLCVRG